MDCQDYTTCQSERERGQHLGLDDRGAIQQMHRLGYSNRAIARAVKCSPTTVGNELCRGTPERQPGRRGPQTRGYTARRGQAAHEANRTRCHRPHRIVRCKDFTQFVVRQVREHRWSLDACVGYSRLYRLFREDEMVCTKTLYNELSAGRLPLSLFEVPELLGRKRCKENSRVHKRAQRPQHRRASRRSG
jgi:IS30 family transposase